MAGTGEYGSSVRMMVSYGGEIVQGDHGPDGKAVATALYYSGGVHRIVKVGLSERLADLRPRMAALASFSDVCIRYAIPGEGLGRLRDVENDGDLWILVSMLFCHEVSKTSRVRVFLFGVEAPLRSASAPSLPALVEEGATTAPSGGACAAPVAQGMPRRSSSPSLATSGGARDGTAVRMKVSYGGDIIQRDGSAAASYYAGGVHRIVRVGLSERLTDLRARLASLAGCSDVRIRYALPGEEGLGHLRDVASDGDLWNLVSLLFFREAVMTSSSPKQGRIRVFLVGVDAPAASPLRRCASSPVLAASSSKDHRAVDGAKHQGGLPSLEEEDEGIDTVAATSLAGGATGARPVTHGMRWSASPLALAASSSGGATSASSGDSAGEGAMQLAPVVWVPVIPVYPVHVVFLVA